MPFPVRDHIPLEQGLRHPLQQLAEGPQRVRDHIPLEQGLRHSSRAYKFHRYICQRPYSIRTRIKTR